MKIVLLEPLGISEERLNELSAGLTRQGHEFIAYDTVESDPEALKVRAAGADILMIANHALPGEVIESVPNLQYISVAFVGIDHIGKDACVAKGIHVSNAAGYCRDAVAELALGLALDCLRNISACNSVVRQSGTKNGLIGHELHGRTVGIIGTGDTGIRTAELYRAFGCRVLGYSRSERESAKQAGVEYVPLDTLLAQSDIVSVHTPLTEQTRGLINAAAIAKMKQGAILINTSRGAVVDSQAVADALQSGHLAAMGTDVFEDEPPVAPSHPLLTAPNVVATPHVAFATVESIDRRAVITFDNVEKWLHGTLQNQML
jgi:D-3-phosphoglycerate dehydrogenase